MTVRAVFAAAAALLAAGTGIAQAQTPEAMIEYRQAVMAANGGHMKSMVSIFKGKVPFTDDLVPHADSIARAAPMLDHLFPEGSGEGDTDALPAIWKSPKDFDSAVDRYQDAAARMPDAARSGERAVFAEALNDLGKACKNCHDDFRKKE